MGSPTQGGSGVIRLRLLRAGQVIRAYEVAADTLTIGSAKECTIRVAGDTAIAPKHATIFIEDGLLTLVPEPRAMVLFNGEQIDFMCVPQPGDVITAGRMVFSVELVGAPLGRQSKPPAKRSSSMPARPQAAPSRTPGGSAAVPKAPQADDELDTNILARSVVEAVIATVAAAPVGAERNYPSIEVELPLLDEDDESLMTNVIIKPSVPPPKAAATAAVQRPAAEPPRQRSSGSSPKGLADVLHLRVIHRDKCIEEKTILCPGPITIGTRDDAVLSLPFENLPRAYVLFKRVAGKYTLAFREEMCGTVSVAGGSYKLEALKALPRVKRQRKSWLCPLDDTASGEISFDGLTIYFDFVPHPSTLLLELPPDVRVGIGMGVDRLFMFFFVFSLVAHLSLLVYCSLIREPDKTALQKVKERWVQVVVEKKRKEVVEQKKAVEKKTEKKKPKESEKKPRETVADSKRPVTRQETTANVNNLLDRLKKEVQVKGAASKLDDIPTTSGAVAALHLIGSNANAGSALNVQRTGGALSTFSGEQVAGKGSGVAAVGTTAKKGAVRGKVTQMASAIRVQGKLSREEVQNVINAHMNEVQSCFERALLNNPTLAGRIGFEWVVSIKGSVRSVRVASSTLGSPQVATCISERIKRWRFPAPKGGEVTITYPFLFRSVSS